MEQRKLRKLRCPFLNLHCSQADNSSQKLWLHCGCQFPLCALTLNLTYTLLFLLQLLSVNLPYRDSIHYVKSHPFSFAWVISENLSKSKAPCNILNILFFNGKGLLAPCSIPKLEDQPLLDVCDHMQYICSYPSYLKVITFICNLRMHHAMVTRDQLK
jgi:hypothetical protein